jgi:hypothetical protein
MCKLHTCKMGCGVMQSSTWSGWRPVLKALVCGKVHVECSGASAFTEAFSVAPATQLCLAAGRRLQRKQAAAAVLTQVCWDPRGQRRGGVELEDAAAVLLGACLAAGVLMECLSGNSAASAGAAWSWRMRRRRWRAARRTACCAAGSRWGPTGRRPSAPAHPSASARLSARGQC